MRRWIKRGLIAIAGLFALAGLALVVFRTPDTDPAAMRAKYGAPPSQFVDLDNGLTVHLRDEGPRDAPVLILLHGSNADLHTWDPWTKLLTSRYRVIRFDQIGHGLTGPSPTGDYSPAAFDRTIGQVAAKLGVTKFALAGNSMGGGIAVHYALAHPDRVTALVLVDSGGMPQPGEESNRNAGNLGFALARTPGVRNVLLSITPRSLIEQSLQQSVTNQTVADSAAVDRYWELLRYPGNREATLDRFAQGWQTFTPDQLATLKLPVLILWGEQDRIIPLLVGKWFERNIAGSRLITYRDAGHLPMEEVAERSAADLLSWLAALPTDKDLATP